MASVTRLDNFGFLAVTGKDAQKFLQGYVTRDMPDVSGARSSIGAICNLQGRMVTSFRMIGVDDGYLLRMNRALVPVTMAFLEKYIVFSKAAMIDRSAELSCYGIMGDMAGAPASLDECTRQDGACVIRVSGAPRFEVWTNDAAWLPQGAEASDAREWRARELDEGIAWVDATTSGEFVPQMFNYHNLGAVDFDKGCYLGQEIVARMQYRGALSRRLYRGKSNRQLRVNDPLQDAAGKTVGRVVAAEGETFLAVVQVKNDEVPDVADCSMEAVA